jgi:hypothetical protein
MAMRIPDPDDAALAALHALTGDTGDIDRATDAEAMHYAETVAAMAEAVSSPPVLGLRGRLLAAAFAERAPGTSIDDGGADTAAVAFARTARELEHLLGELDDLDWVEDAHPAIGRVRDVVAHLLAIEHDLDLSPFELRRRWRQAAEPLADAAQGAAPETAVELHGLHVDVESTMFLRTFELWGHLDDIARATGRRRPRLDARRLRAMSAALMDVLPVALTVAGHADVRGRIDVVLTGPGGGTYHVAVGAPADRVDCTLTVDVVDLCRLAARRATVEQLDVRVDGDRSLADAVLASVSAFAMD